jgi:hypothetical protein
MTKSPIRPVIAAAGAAALTFGGMPAALAAQHPASHQEAWREALARLAAMDPQPKSTLRADMAKARGLPATVPGGPGVPGVSNGRTGKHDHSLELVDAAEIRANDVKTLWLKGLMQDAAKLHSRTVRPDCGGVCGSGAEPQWTLTENRQKEQHPTWCGPASASEALGQLGKSVSQATLADSSNLNTVNDDGTNWGSTESTNPMTKTLNKYESVNYYIPVALNSVTTATIDGYENDLVADVYYVSAPLIADVVLVNSSPLLAGEPKPGTDGQESPVYHWFDIRGYSGSGATTDYEDSSFSAYGSESSKDAVIQISGRGYVW